MYKNIYDIFTEVTDMISSVKVYSLPRELTRSEPAKRAFSSLPADEREAFAEGFSVLRRGSNDTSAAEQEIFMQNPQNQNGILC